MIALPFHGLRPRTEIAPKLHVPPYDVVNAGDVKAHTAGNPVSFFHVTRSDAEMPEVDEHSEAVYRKARENLLAMVEKGDLVREEKPAYYFLSQTWQGRTQRGLYARVSCEEYLSNDIKKHELTRKDKEKDRTDHIGTVGADTGPVFLAFRDRAGYSDLIQAAEKLPVTYRLTDENNVQIELTAITDAALVSHIEHFFQTVPAFYIADGHHRAASAINVYKEKGKNAGGFAYFMAVLFPASELAILPYNRAVNDLNGLSEKDFLSRIASDFTVEETSAETPSRRGEFIMFMPGKRMKLTPKAGKVDMNDPIASLDVAVLQSLLLSPVLGIEDPRTSTRIRFVGGIKGPGELKRQVENKEAAVAFAMYPVSMDELFAVSDAGKIMPPKSTWFEPKLRDGLATYWAEKE